MLEVPPNSAAWITRKEDGMPSPVESLLEGNLEVALEQSGRGLLKEEENGNVGDIRQRAGKGVRESGAGPCRGAFPRPDCVATRSRGGWP